MDGMMISAKSERIGKFLTICSPDSRKRVVKYIFVDSVPVVHFAIDDAAERKIAVIALIERGLCNNKTAGELCGFHRNTVSKIIQTKEFLGIEAALLDDRGLKKPYKYIDEICSHINGLLSEHPGWKDQDIADQAGKDLPINISRSAVARIRTGNQDKPELPNKTELLDLAKQAELFEKEHLAQRQLWLNFDTEPELKQKAEECSKESPPQAKNDAQQSFIGQLQQGTK